MGFLRLQAEEDVNAVVGFVAIFAGFFGAFYKLIADAVAKGRTMAPTEG